MGRKAYSGVTEVITVPNIEKKAVIEELTGLGIIEAGAYKQIDFFANSGTFQVVEDITMQNIVDMQAQGANQGGLIIYFYNQFSNFSLSTAKFQIPYNETRLFLEYGVFDGNSSDCKPPTADQFINRIVGQSITETESIRILIQNFTNVDLDLTQFTAMSFRLGFKSQKISG